MRAAASPANKGYKRGNVTLPAPVRGWNTQDSLSATEPGYALVLDNWVITPSDIAVRGRQRLVVGIEGTIESVVSYDYKGEKKIFAAGNGNIYECDFNEKTSSVLKEEQANNRWENIFYEGYLYFFNGVDTPLVYKDGELNNAGFSGTSLDLTKLSGGALYKNRLFLIEKGSLKFHYTQDAGAKTGPLLDFDLAQMSDYGGELALICTWTYSSSAGAQESQIIFITNQGEAFVYAGTDPSDAEAWALRGKYKIPKPLGKRCAEAVGGDIAYISEEGYFLLSNLLSTPVSTRAVMFGDKINNTVSVLKNSFTNFGWQIKDLGADDILIINVPVSATAIEQHVLNKSRGAWSRFTGINALAWTVLDGKAYFCGDGGLSSYGDEASTEDVKWAFELAFTNMGVPTAKIVKEIIIFLNAYKTLAFNLVASVDFAKANVIYTASPSAAESPWDLSKWDQTPWPGEARALSKRIVARTPPGQYFSFGLAGNTAGQPVQFISMDVFFETTRNLV